MNLLNSIKSGLEGVSSFLSGFAQRNPVTAALLKPGITSPIPTKTSLNFLKSVAQGTARSVATTGLTVMNPILKAGGQEKINIPKPTGPGLQQTVFGNEPIQDLRDRTARFRQEHPQFASLALPAVGAGILADLIPGGGAEKRGFTETVKASEKTLPKVAAAVEDWYKPITNVETLQKAQQLIAKNYDEAVRLVKDTKTTFTAETAALGQELARVAQQEGRVEDAIDIIKTVAERATTSGQAIQALTMWNRLSDEGILKYAVGVLQRAGQPTTKLTKPVADEIVTLARKARETGNAIDTAKTLDKIAQLVPASLSKKISELQIMAQLLNPKTIIRNIGGNAAFAAIENVSDTAAAALDSAMSLITKKRTISLPSLKAQAKGLYTGFIEGAQDAVAGVNRQGLQSQYDIPRTSAFRGKVGKLASKTLNMVLGAPDRAFYTAARDGSLYRQMKTAGVSTPTDAMLEQAHLDGLYRTFQDVNPMSDAFQMLQTGLNKLGTAVGIGTEEFGLGTFVLRYPKTPGALLMRGIEYSPMGLIRTAYQLASGTANQKTVAEAIARSGVGTAGLIGTGAVLHRLGILKSSKTEDADTRTLEQTAGLNSYQVNLSAARRFALSGFNPEAVGGYQKGDTLVTYDWIQPSAIGLSLGANFDAKQGDKTSIVSRVLDALTSGTQTITEQPLLAGVKKLAQQQDVSQGLKQVLIGIPASFVPTILNQVKQLSDNRQRNAYDPDALTYMRNLAQNKVPFLANKLPVRVGPFGQPMETYQNSTNNLFNVFFNPAFVTHYNPSPEAKFILDLVASTGETTQVPRIYGSSQITVNGEKMRLNNRQLTAAQAYSGYVTKFLLDNLMRDERFTALPDSAQVKYISGLLTDIGQATKFVVLGDRPVRKTSSGGTTGGLSKDATGIIQMFPRWKPLVDNLRQD